MKVSYQWLSALAPDLSLTSEELVEHLALRGAPVEEIDDLGAPFADLVVGRVVQAGRHPDADRLSLCSVDAGREEPLQVICGAPNVKEGSFYPFAPVGSVLPGGMKIKKAKIRGVHSHGMLCSERELGLGRDHEGILELHGALTPGQPLVQVMALDDVRLDIEVSPNRGDLLSHLGVAREVAPTGHAGLVVPPVPGGAPYAAPISSDPTRVESGGFHLQVDDGDLCYRFLAVVIRGVRIGPSPDWLANRLRAVGAQPINNVVDVTNYLMLELGHPMHAYDLDRLEGSTLIARRARAGETIETLDGVSRALTPEMMVICDGSGPVGIGGIMGGADSEVTDNTTNVLLEAALFDPPSIRATRRALDMSTDASYRFERGVDPALHEEAIRRGAEMIMAVAGGTPDGNLLDVCPRPWAPSTVSLRPARASHLLGVEFDAASCSALLEPLGFRVDAQDPSALTVTVPGFRSYDVTREVDLIEEVARTHGYDAFPDQLESFRPGTVPDHPLFQLEDRLKTLLVARGLFETQTPAFGPASEGEVELNNPISQNDTHMRRWIMPALSRRVAYNFSRGNRNVRLFEIGTSFRAGEADGPPAESTHLAFVFTGFRSPPHWANSPQDVDIWDLKALAEAVASAACPGSTVGESAEEHPLLVPGMTLEVRDGEGRPVGWAGQVRAGTLEAPAWAGAVFGFEMVLPDHPDGPPSVLAEALPAFPGMDRDMALLAGEGITARTMLDCIEAAGGKLLASVAIFDQYDGEGLPSGVRSVAYRLRFQSPERTLTDRDVERATDRILRKLKEELGVQARG